MKRILLKRGEVSVVVCDISTPELRLSGYQRMFEIVRPMYPATDLMEPVDGQLFSQAVRGNARAALAFLLLHEEELRLAEVDVEEIAAATRPSVKVNCPEAVSDANMPAHPA